MTPSTNQIEHVSPSSLNDDPRNTRTHPKKQIAQIMRSIERFGFNCPVVVRPDGTILAGHGRVAAARQLGLKTIPVIRVEHLSETECRAFMIADNKIAANAGWDFELLASELQGLIDLDIDVSLSDPDLEDATDVEDEGLSWWASAPDGPGCPISDPGGCQYD